MYNFLMKLVIQIQCHNEEDNIGALLETLPQNIKGIDEISTIVLNDASCDNTEKIAKQYGVEVLSFKKRIGLSGIFKIGVDYALSKNADILVNIDGDNQYKAGDIEKLIQPITEKRADISIGSRPINNIKSFSFTKKILQKVGSYIVSLISKTDVKDVPSGFRAFNREALLKINVFNPFTYTIETIIQAYSKNLTTENVDISVNIQNNRKSRLFKNNFDYVFKQAKNLLRFFIIYRPARFFTVFGILLLIFGLCLGIRFLFYSTGHIQSLILCAIVSTLSFMCFMLAIIGDLLSINRKMLEEIRYELRSAKFKK